MLKDRLFLFEYLLILYSFPGLINSRINASIYNAGLIIIVWLMYKFKGFRNNILYILVGAFLSMIPYNHAIKLFGWLVLVYSNKYFPNYYY